MRPYLKAMLFSLGLTLLGHATAADHRAEILNQMATALAQGQCDAIMQRQFQTTVTGRTTTGDYIADNGKLHECQYVQEIIVSHCTKAKSCPSYEQWSRQNPSFTPNLPRHVFITELELRRQKLNALRTPVAK